MTKARLIAFYLPQFHPIPENDLWWGKGFTEWTNVAKAKPLFKGHMQPNLPADLGFYDLRVPEVREAQAELARNHGIEAFCYWHYWFGNGKRLLERPFTEVLKSGKPDFPFCLAWANQTWTGIWHGAPDRVLIEQTYPGPTDHERHFYELLPAFHDQRYLRIDGKPLFLLYDPFGLPDLLAFTHQWRSLAVKEGLSGLHLMGIVHFQESYKLHGLDSVTFHPPLGLTKNSVLTRVARKLGKFFGSTYIKKLSYTEFLNEVSRRYQNLKDYEFPTVVPNWDNTPRSGKNGYILSNSSPEAFAKALAESCSFVGQRSRERQLVFIKSWNEWAEGNHLEPNAFHGKAYLEAVSLAIKARGLEILLSQNSRLTGKLRR
jgi:lipopolysaccharide biosynthesis protein